MSDAFDKAVDMVARCNAEIKSLRKGNRDLQLHFDVLKADYERLRAALRPFAEAADGFDNVRIKNPEEWFAYGGVVSATEVKGAITVGDLRRARAALDGQPAPGKGDC